MRIPLDRIVRELIFVLQMYSAIHCTKMNYGESETYGHVFVLLQKHYFVVTKFRERKRERVCSWKGVSVPEGSVVPYWMAQKQFRVYDFSYSGFSLLVPKARFYSVTRELRRISPFHVLSSDYNISSKVYFFFNFLLVLCPIL